jgi:hypothetical protein
VRSSFVVLALLLAVPGCPAPVRDSPEPSGSIGPSAAGARTPPACLDARFVYAEALGLVLANCVDQADTDATEELWAWDGERWQSVASGGPTAHVVTSVAWDEDRDVLVRYGGIPLPQQGCAAETWEWDARTGWVQLDVEPPPACDHARLAFDAARGVTVLAGGGDEAQRLISGTWAWDGESWERVAIHGPEPRAHFGFAYDNAHRQTLLFGGYDGRSVYEDLWSWDGAAWTQLELDGPGARSHIGMAVSPDGLLVFGGATGTSTFTTLSDETWYLTDGAWQQPSGRAPSPRGLPALGYDPAREVMVLYGGFAADGEPLSDLWEWDGSWTCVTGCT